MTVERRLGEVPEHVLIQTISASTPPDFNNSKIEVPEGYTFKQALPVMSTGFGGDLYTSEIMLFFERKQAPSCTCSCAQPDAHYLVHSAGVCNCESK